MAQSVTKALTNSGAITKPDEKRHRRVYSRTVLYIRGEDAGLDDNFYPIKSSQALTNSDIRIENCLLVCSENLPCMEEFRGSRFPSIDYNYKNQSYHNTLPYSVLKQEGAILSKDTGEIESCYLACMESSWSKYKRLFNDPCISNIGNVTSGSYLNTISGSYFLRTHIKTWKNLYELNKDWFDLLYSYCVTNGVLEEKYLPGHEVGDDEIKRLYKRLKFQLR